VIDYIEPEDVDALVTRLAFHYRDQGRALLLSALASPMPVFGQEVFPDLVTKGAVLLDAINRNHPMADGNKRLSWILTVAFFEINGVDVVASQDEIVEFVFAVADHRLTVTEIGLWLGVHLRPLA
jgi:death-on-curing protein